MRLKSEIWVKAYIRSCQSHGVPAVVLYRGDADAGAIFIKIDLLNGFCHLFVPAPAGLDMIDTERKWVPFSEHEPVSLEKADTHISKQRNFDPDIWVIEVESPQGDHFLDDFLSKTADQQSSIHLFFK